MDPTSVPVRIVFLDRETLSPETILREPGFPHTLKVYSRTALDDVAERIADAEIVITNKVRLSAEAISAAPRLRFVAVAATGYDVVDVTACKERGIVVSNIRGYAETTVPEHVFALVLALRRSLVAYNEAVARGRWQEAKQFCFFDYPIRDLAGSTLGIIGRGALGQATARIGRALGMTVEFAGRKGATGTEDGRVPFDEFLATTDVVSLHCPLTPETRGLIGDAEFDRMKRRPLLINASRGGLVDEEALGRALDEGRISGAGFDVTMPEPPPTDSPLMRLVGRPDFILTPHVAWASREAIQTLADQLVDLLEAFQVGQPRNRVA
jgi:glycerate dehydrogenase